MRNSLIAAAALASAALASTSLSAERLRVRVGADTPYSECYCRAKGGRFPVGESVCIRVGETARLATCGMEQNVTSWRFTTMPCPES